MLGCLATNIEIGVISLFAVVPFRYQIRHADSGLMEMRCDTLFAVVPFRYQIRHADSGLMEMRCDTYEHKGVLLQAD